MSLEQAYFGLAWSLSAEAFLYLVYVPVTLVILKRIRSVRATTWAVVILCLAASSLVWVAYHYSIGDHWLLYKSPYMRIPEFLPGALVAHLVTIRGVNRPFPGVGILGLTGALAVGVLIFVTAYWRPDWYPRIEWSWGYAMPVAAVVTYLCLQRSWASALFGSAFIVMLGDSSYSLYLLHPYMRPLFPRPFVGWSNLYCALIYLTLCSIVSVGVYRAYEAPARAFVRTRLRNTRLVTAAGISAVVVLSGSLFYIAADAGDWFAPPSVSIVSATYGANCGPNVKPGNSTLFFKRACRGLMTCSQTIDAAVMGDPAGGCSKSLEIEYTCPGTGKILSLNIPQEAHGKSVTIACHPL